MKFSCKADVYDVFICIIIEHSHNTFCHSAVNYASYLKSNINISEQLRINNQSVLIKRRSFRFDLVISHSTHFM
jgi:hypothetical protein